jgi:hypothetical protein
VRRSESLGVAEDEEGIVSSRVSIDDSTRAGSTLGGIDDLRGEDAICAYTFSILACRTGVGWGMVLGLTLVLFSRSLSYEYCLGKDSRLKVRW